MMGRIKKKLYLFVAIYFRFWASISFRRWKPRVVAVTGSVGKTTMLRLLELQLGERAHYSHNANSAFGVAFDIVGLRGITSTKWRWLYLFVAVPIRALWFRYDTEFYVVEIDGERPRETDFLARWLKPEVTLWVSLGRSHASYYDHQVASGKFATVDQAIAYEFGALPRMTQKFVIAAGNNELIDQQLETLSVPVETVRISDLQSYKVWPDHTEFRLASGTVSFACPMPREVAVQLLILERLAAYLRMELMHNMSSFKPAPGRNSFLAGKHGVKLIDSSYNAHLISMQALLDMMNSMQVDHKWLVIGDMTEQGEGEADQHQKLGQALIQTPADRYVLVGRRVGLYTAPILKEAGLGDKTKHFTHATLALEYLENELAGNEVVLFKGSQYLEWIVEKLLANPDDVKELPRQEPSAKRRRAEWGLK